MARKPWKHSEGQRPNRVTVFERAPGGTLYIRVWDPTMGAKGAFRKRSLGHTDRDRAKVYAAEQYAKLARGQQELRAGRVTLARVFALYRRYRSPRKTPGEQIADERRSQLWTRWLGGEKDPHQVSMREWESLIDARSSGEIDARGNRVMERANRRPVRARSVEADCDWLRWVCNWAVKWRTGAGHYLMTENPVRGLEAPSEKNVRRPVATQDRFEALRAKTDEVMMEVRWNGGRRETRRSYLSELLDVVNGTGRRISAICSLRYRDLQLSDGTPYGSICWPADTDKQGRESTVPISAHVRAAIDRIQQLRPGIGGAPLFPSPHDPGEPIRYELASDWLREAEKLAEVEPHEGSLWHAYRRKWATERKHLPATDVAKAGGWSGPETMQNVYQQADQETMLRVVLEPGELREAK